MEQPPLKTVNEIERLIIEGTSSGQSTLEMATKIAAVADGEDLATVQNDKRAVYFFFGFNSANSPNISWVTSDSFEEAVAYVRNMYPVGSEITFGGMMGASQMLAALRRDQRIRRIKPDDAIMFPIFQLQQKQVRAVLEGVAQKMVNNEQDRVALMGIASRIEIKS